MHLATNNLLPVAGTGQRRTIRYTLDSAIDIMANGQRCGLGALIDISSSGAAFECFNKLAVGRNYTFRIHVLGTFQGRIVRHFNCTSYGLNFTGPDNFEDVLEVEIRRLGQPK
ncbi:PilZ domain-containing protein [Parvularcula sp. LCG005]|uniref:PilZ domain-containing protein n=1 Tax=Parvularcula sp. LCG005 TaxID=3078805 RepID=UPI0029434464|nr:PilZ domain-containing protein [Parvularcula sp. LCG005]WOI52621.1 PilZ domain-containing protein [Parvularcula sp. LCG005]